MKIIGESKDGLILSAEKGEVARLVGYYGTSDCKTLQVGMDIQVNEMFMQLYRVRHVKGSIKSIADAAKDLLQAIETKSPVIAPIIAEIAAKEPKS